MSFIRYVGVQLIVYAVEFGSFLFLVGVGWLGPVTANALLKAAAAVLAFIMHRYFTFPQDKDLPDRASPHCIQALRYGFLLGLNIPVSSLILYLLLFVITPAPVSYTHLTLPTKA